ATNGACGTGALAASSGVVLNTLLDGIEGTNSQNLNPAERDARANLLNTLITGTAAALGGETTTAQIASQIETENNALLSAPAMQRITALSAGDAQQEARLVMAGCALKQCSKQFPEGSAAYNFYLALETEGNTPPNAPCWRSRHKSSRCIPG
ncbi:MAG: hypothetical protein LBF16_09965, partial [Pseudomonadales bacterium]|nr:hypothetical protein [Pseudomonadales bacterium]